MDPLPVTREVTWFIQTYRAASVAMVIQGVAMRHLILKSSFCWVHTQLRGEWSMAVLMAPPPRHWWVFMNNLHFHYMGSGPGTRSPASSW